MKYCWLITFSKNTLRWFSRLNLSRWCSLLILIGLNILRVGDCDQTGVSSLNWWPNIPTERVKCVKSGWKYADGDQDNLLQILIQHLGFHKRFAPLTETLFHKWQFFSQNSQYISHFDEHCVWNVLFRRGPGNMIALRCSECIFAHYPVCRWHKSLFESDEHVVKVSQCWRCQKDNTESAPVSAVWSRKASISGVNSPGKLGRNGEIPSQISNTDWQIPWNVRKTLFRSGA